jgi:large subunit ribosomal protein L13
MLKTKEKTKKNKTNKKLEKEIIEIDAANKSLGRVAVMVAKYLQGKHKVDYLPYIDYPIYVKLKNWDKIIFTGNKLEKRYIFKHTGYWGHLRKYLLKDLWQRKPLFVIQKAVKGMLPKNKLRERKIKRIILS